MKLKKKVFFPNCFVVINCGWFETKAKQQQKLKKITLRSDFYHT